MRTVRRVVLALGAFVIACLVIGLLATWIFGSGNVLVYVLAAPVGVATYLELLRRDRARDIRQRRRE
jgi:hypothetical protein